MRKLLSSALHNRPFVFVLAGVLCVTGTLAMAMLPRELLPPTTAPRFAIVTEYTAADPQAMDVRVSQPIATAIGSVDELASVSTVSSASNSLVLAGFHLGADLDAIEQRLDKAMDAAGRALPEGVRPMIRAASVDDVLIVQAALTPAEGGLSTATRQAVSAALAGIPGVRAGGARLTLEQEHERTGEARVTWTASGKRRHRVRASPSGRGRRTAERWSPR
ncbi:Mg++/citrate complex transporter [Leifsonia xyli subsp. cynodontis DSM 46306]|jgi:HAE1 family hydrophobic/amphiphilic exporter-1|uniref:Uncharacterized protein n=1 Tax=Leifsonia xyli subsp. cynodontis DSM 46306 TaxID=1389489 RepID=U3P5C6_LEIXC|nr:efflux RND transporter permease subunit [Leifsonia xyli]AGW40956.1 Mg++/citrate complex transporter [Leifsonia xyli subsp. cynodontis DSM 46306]